jgi:Subtilase family
MEMMWNVWKKWNICRKWAPFGLALVAAWGTVETEAAPVQIALPRSATLHWGESNQHEYVIHLKSGSTPTPAVPDVMLCLNSAFEMPGQAWHVDLSAGGITNRALSLPAREIVDAPTRLNQLMLNKVTYLPKDPAKITILVIDDFQLSKIRLDEDKTGPETIVSFELRHGALVVSHLEMILYGAGFTKVLSRPERFMIEGDTFISKDRKRSIHIMPFDYGKLRKNYNGGPKVVTVEDLNKTLVREIGSSLNGSPTIINMSFSLIPCNIMQRYIELKNIADTEKDLALTYPFRDYLLEIEKLSTDLSLWKNGESLKSILTTISKENLFFKWIDGRKISHDTLLVASSGNYKLPFETMPASWPGVIGVGAISVATPNKADWSDASDVFEVGEWLLWPKLLPSYLCLTGTAARCVASPGSPISVGQFAYRGTSFSAPTVSATLAVMYGTTTCPLSLSHSWPLAKLQLLSFPDFMRNYCH